MDREKIIEAFKRGLVVCHLKGQQASIDPRHLCDFVVNNVDALLANQIDLSKEP